MKCERTACGRTSYGPSPYCCASCRDGRPHCRSCGRPPDAALLHGGCAFRPRLAQPRLHGLGEAEAEDSEEEADAEAEPAKETGASAGSGEDKVAASLKGKLIGLKGGDIADAELTGNPEYYVLYHSASW